ncbi:MAG TPA: hypothetical protein EYP98_12185, partial [Planctomycetes bacterium]|nr:hypothetical protein [Planctomycetota bacterium]
MIQCVSDVLAFAKHTTKALVHDRKFNSQWGAIAARLFVGRERTLVGRNRQRSITEPRMDIANSPQRARSCFLQCPVVNIVDRKAIVERKQSLQRCQLGTGYRRDMRHVDNRLTFANKITIATRERIEQIVECLKGQDKVTLGKSRRLDLAFDV